MSTTARLATADQTSPPDRPLVGVARQRKGAPGAGRLRWILGSLFLLAGCAVHEQRVAPTPGVSDERLLHETVAAHLAAIHARDLEALLATVTGADSLALVLPNGTTTFTRREYAEFHRVWFGDTSWAMSFQPLSATMRESFAVLLFRTTYTDGRGARAGLVSLTFAREQGGWRLVFDQNTPLPSS